MENDRSDMWVNNSTSKITSSASGNKYWKTNFSGEIYGIMCNKITNCAVKILVAGHTLDIINTMGIESICNFPLNPSCPLFSLFHLFFRLFISSLVLIDFSSISIIDLNVAICFCFS